MKHHKDIDLADPEWWMDGFIRKFRREAYKSLELAAAVSEITPAGFFVTIYYNTDNWQKTYKEKLYVSTECFPYFQGATVEEIEDVIRLPNCSTHDDRDVLSWDRFLILAFSVEVNMTSTDMMAHFVSVPVKLTGTGTATSGILTGQMPQPTTHTVFTGEKGKV